MHKVVSAAPLAVGLITAPKSQFVSSAAAQKQASTEKNARRRSRGPVSLRRASDRRSAARSARKQRPQRSRKEPPGQSSGALATSVSSPPPIDIACTRERRNAHIKRLRASARLKSRRRPQGHPNRGVPG